VIVTEDPCNRQDGTITVLDLASGRATLLEASRIPGPSLCCDGYYRPSWSPDGTRLAFAMPPLAAFIIDADGRNLRALGQPGATGTAPRWSPDGSTIASGTCGVQPMLYLVDPDGRNPRTVETSGCDFKWTRDGRIVFRDQAAGPFEPNHTWIMDADGGNLQRLDDSVAALTDAGCIVCPLLDADRLVTVGLWQPVPANQP
jgi:dipeptidyl aminopeptidase/acylaminoacyl peptidase